MPVKRVALLNCEYVDITQEELDRLEESVKKEFAEGGPITLPPQATFGILSAKERAFIVEFSDADAEQLPD